MRKVNKPEDIPVKVFQKCISNYKDKVLKNRLMSYSDEIKEASKTYEEKVKSTTLHTLPLYKGIVNKEEMIKVYNDKFSKLGQPGRIFYDKIMALPKLKKCPLCGQRIVSTLDHHLPKTKFPALAVTPINLIPACFECNKLKTAKKPSKAEEETLHPYFDDIEDDLWLLAQVVHDNPVSFKFFVEPPDHWDELKTKRVRYHFVTFKLGQLYSLYAAEELSLRLLLLKKIFNKAGPEAVREQLVDFTKSSEEVYLNSWQSAMYRALANDEWFCTKGING
ncbi:HNH endonuclease [Bacillus spizizenii]|uniref:HNH endonuclease n=1 Tax=Bacillus subtilis TaxID=1423 RepID=UPI001ABE9E43|nr:HNH endonuclease signature motif containing protein [Bacillus subtilis]MBO3767595.1 HNH endonuclease [Bacillus subtilis]MCY7761163.1 HNH endonuclease [Bacillus spizizenii]